MIRALLMLLTVGCLADPVKLDWTHSPEDSIHPIRSRDGQAIFLRELYSLRRQEDFSVAQFSGFNAVIETAPEVFTNAKDSGFWITEANWYSTHSTDQHAIAEAEAYRQEPALIAYNLNDEPDLRTHIHGPGVMARISAVLHQYDPRAKTSVTLAGWGSSQVYWPAFAEAVDILRVDPYPLISNKPLSHVRDLVVAARQVAPGKPVVAILQAWSWPGSPFPDAAQTRHMAYQSLIAGANGLSFFDWNDAVWSAHPAFWREVIRLNRELKILEPFLTTGQRFVPIEKDGIYAGLWMLDGRWFVAAVDLQETGVPRELSLQIPGLDAPFPLMLPATGSRLFTSKTVMSQPKKRSASWSTDWAGRSLHPAENTLSPFMGPSAPVSIRVDGPFPGEADLDTIGNVFRICPGGIFRYTLHIQHAEDVRLISWQDNQQTLTELTQLVTLRRTTAANLRREGRTLIGKQQWELDVHLPTDRDWQMHRDHLLTLELLVNGQRLNRVIRFRLQSPFGFAWEWLDNQSGKITVTPSFPEDFYQIPEQEWQLEISGDGFELKLENESPLSATVHLTANPEAQGLHGLSAKLTAGDVTLGSGGLTQAWLSAGNIILPNTPKTGTAKRLDLDPQADFDTLWSATAQLPVSDRFLSFGSHSYAAPAHRAWFAYDDTNLYWFMESPKFGDDFRAETTQRDGRFLGDTLMVMLFQIPQTDRAYLLQINPAGTVSDQQLSPNRDPGWNPNLQIRTSANDQVWRLICAIPWADLQLNAPPAQLAINLGTARSIAPRIRTSWHYWGIPFNPQDSLAPLTLTD